MIFKVTKRYLYFIIVSVLLFIPSIYAEEQWLTYDWSLKQGQAYYWEAINWTHTAEVSDGYITATLNEDGLGILRKISKDGKSIIWEYLNEYGYYFGNTIVYGDYIYVPYFDPYYGTFVAKYDSNGKWQEEVQLNDYNSEDYDTSDIYNSEIYLVDNKLYLIYQGKLKDSTGIKTDNVYAPLYLYTIDIDTFKLEKTEDYWNTSSDEKSTISDGNVDLLDRNLNSIYSESGYTTYFTTSIVSNKYKYYVGFLQETSSQGTIDTGLIVKTDINGNVLWVKKGSTNEKYYDIINLGDNHVAVSTYNTNGNGWSGNSNILVFDNDGNIVETHDIASEIGSSKGDIITFRRMGNAVVAQVVNNVNTENSSTIADSYVVRYIPRFIITTRVEGEGSINVVKTSQAGENITFTVTPAEGYVLGSVKVTDINDNVLTFTSNTFTMPSSDVIIEATFVPNNPETDKTIIHISVIIIGTLISLIFVSNFRKKLFYKI